MTSWLISGTRGQRLWHLLGRGSQVPDWQSRTHKSDRCYQHNCSVEPGRLRWRGAKKSDRNCRCIPKILKMREHYPKGTWSLEEVWPMTGINSQARTTNKPTVNETGSRQKWEVENLAYVEGKKKKTCVMRHMVSNQYRTTPDEPSNGQKPAEASFSPLWLRGQEHVGLFYIEPHCLLVWTPDTESWEKFTDRLELVEKSCQRLGCLPRTGRFLILATIMLGPEVRWIFGIRHWSL